MIDEEALAGALYSAYCNAVGGVAFNGDKLPSWEKFSVDSNKEKQADAWRTVADKAITLLIGDEDDE